MKLTIIQTPDYILGVDNRKLEIGDTIIYGNVTQINHTICKIDEENYANLLGLQEIMNRPNFPVPNTVQFRIIVAHTPLNGNKSLEGVPLLPDFELEEDFWENMPVRWVKWTRKKPDWNGSVYMQFNGKNQGNGLVHNKELIKLSGLANSEFKNYEDTFYWLEQDFNYYKAYNAAGGYTEEDMKNVVMSVLRDLNTHNETDKPVNFVWVDSFNNYMQSLKPFPIEFEVEMEIVDNTKEFTAFSNPLINLKNKPKIINKIVQGKFIWK